jgi:hypothetical protein
MSTRADSHLIRIDVACGDPSAATEKLDALVVSVHGLAAVVDGPECAVRKGQHDNGGVDVAGFPNLGRDAHGALRVDGTDLAAYEETGHVKVVDHHVGKQPARCEYIGDRRRGRVAADNVQ